MRPITTPQKTQDLRSALFKLCDCLSQTEYCGKNISETLTYFRTRYQRYLLIEKYLLKSESQPILSCLFFLTVILILVFSYATCIISMVSLHMFIITRSITEKQVV